MMSSFNYPHVVPNLYGLFSSSAENKRRYFEECWWPNSLAYFYYMETHILLGKVNYPFNAAIQDRLQYSRDSNIVLGTQFCVMHKNTENHNNPSGLLLL